MDGSTPKRINEMVTPRGHGGDRRRREFHRIKQAVTGAVLLVVVAGIVLIGLLLYRSQTTPGIDGSKYQAVFMTNGQVYFGKLKALNGQYMQLSDIYYLQTSSTTDSESLQNAAASSAADVQLIKLGNEVHGPEDQMVIAKDQILFFENLKVDGKVAKSIAEYKKK